MNATQQSSVKAQSDGHHADAEVERSGRQVAPAVPRVGGVDARSAISD